MTLRLKGHKLTVHWNGEHGYESSSTGVCTCGWEESGSSRGVVQSEYRWHLERERERVERNEKEEVAT